MLPKMRRLILALMIAFSPFYFVACSGAKPLGPDAAATQKSEGVPGRKEEGNVTPAAAETAPRITILDAAAKHFAMKAADANLKPEYVLVIGLKEGGDKVFKDGGDKHYSYTLMQTDDPVDWDKHFRVESNGVKVGVVKGAARFLDGLSISLAQLDEGTRLRFDNPNLAMLMESDRSNATDAADTPMLAPIPQTKDAPREASGDDGRETSSVLKKTPESE